MGRSDRRGDKPPRTKIVWLAAPTALLLLCRAAAALLPFPLPVDAPAAPSLPGDPPDYAGFSELLARGSLREEELPAPDDQSDALGYDEGAPFKVPEGLRSRVAFWKDIYAVYTSSQALLHDSDYPEIRYGIVDLSPVLSRRDLSAAARQKDLNDLLKREKDRVSADLKTLHSRSQTPLEIPLELFGLYRRLLVLPPTDRFKGAAERVRAQVGQRDRIVHGFLFGGRYFPAMMEIFEKQGVPKELTRLVLVESAFDLEARSKVGASGIWQFMRDTGQQYLRIDRALDERNDPLAATRAAAELLRHNYEALESWPLAVTAYNHGRQGMRRAVQELGTRDLTEIIRRYRSPTFGFASSNFFSEFLAILEVEREFRGRFGRIMVDDALEFEAVALDRDVALRDAAVACATSAERLVVLNPGLTDWVVSGQGAIPAGYSLRIPRETGRCAAWPETVAPAARPGRRIATRERRLP